MLFGVCDHGVNLQIFSSPATSVNFCTIISHDDSAVVGEWELLLQPNHIPTRRRGLPNSSGADSVLSVPFLVSYLHTSWSTPLRNSENSLH